MCGYIGQFSKNEINSKTLNNCNDLILCRGPDEKKLQSGTVKDYFLNKSMNHFSFIFNRLKILDLTPFSSQPMYSDRFNTTLMFNGEIYNHIELRRNLESKGVKFFSKHSDTEVLLNGISFYGINFVEKLVGQFSISFFDGNLNELTLIRDRVGQKPLFYGYDKLNLFFGSNLKSLILAKGENKLNQKSLYEFLELGVVTSPNTIFENFYKVEPGQIIVFDLNKEFKIKTKYKYWEPEQYIGNTKFIPEQFFKIFSEAVNIREIADVSIATYLSGGIDSTSIIKNMKDRDSIVNSFSIIYDDQKYDESYWSDLVSKKYLTNHISLKISGNELFDSLINSIEIFDEPYADPSTVPSYFLAKEISKKFKVAISGDGGDELMGGYTRTSQLMSPLRKRLSFLSQLNKIYPSFMGSGNNFQKYSQDLGSAYASYFSDGNFVKLLNIKQESNFIENYFFSHKDIYKSLMVSEYKFYLPEMMMLKIDRTSMANSLEVRSPFVDHRLIEYVLGTDSKYYNYKTPKYLLKDYLYNDFGNSFVDRRKMGFVFNLENWIFSNIDHIEEIVIKNNANLDLSNFKKLLINKSRINANRIWKLFFLENYLNSVAK